MSTAYVVVTAATVLVILVSGVLGMGAATRARSSEALTEVAIVVAATIGNRSPASAPVSTLPAPSGLIIALVNADGSVHLNAPELPPVIVDALAAAPRRPASGTIRSADGSPYLYALQPVGGSEDDASVLAVIRRMPDVGEPVRVAALVIAAAAVAAVAAAALLLRRQFRDLVAPVGQLRDVTRRYALGQLDFDWTPAGPKEVRDLGWDLQRMSTRLRSRLDAVSTQRNQLETVLSSMVEGVIALDGNDQITRFNRAAGELLGIAPSEAIGKPLLAVVRVPELHEIARDARNGTMPIERTIDLVRQNVSHFQVHATRIGVERGHLPGGVLIVLNDISRIRHLEAVRTDFVANVSHELKTPVTSIKGFVETLIDDPSIEPEQVTRFLGIVLKHTNRLNNILEDLLSLSRLEQADLHIELVSCEVDEVVGSAIEVCKPKADAKGITISQEFGPETGIRANPGLLEHAVLNLVDNAIKYSGEGSRVIVSATVDPDGVSIAVKDHGIGIRTQDLPRVFERFYRTDKARSRELGGTGLGLAIVKHIAILHGGEVTVESSPGEGSMFTMTIPRSPA